MGEGKAGVLQGTLGSNGTALLRLKQQGWIASK
jgi:hypothetical protein